MRTYATGLSLLLTTRMTTMRRIAMIIPTTTMATIAYTQLMLVMVAGGWLGAPVVGVVPVPTTATLPNCGENCMIACLVASYVGNSWFLRTYHDWLAINSDCLSVLGPFAEALQLHAT